jgi:hypothetical protein
LIRASSERVDPELDFDDAPWLEVEDAAPVADGDDHVA